jgi:5-amino-6-(5-phosphoribosylamino)uracil reductase
MRVISNTAISLDGRINTTEGGYIQLGSTHDHQLMSKLRAEADAVLVGGSTFRNGPHPLLPIDPAPSRRWWNVVVTRTLAVPLLPEFVHEPRIRPLLLTRQQPLPENFPSTVEVEGYDGPLADPPVRWMLDCLQRRGVKTLLVEAGGELLFQFLAADALDELYVTLCPLLIGGHTTPSLMGGAGFSLAEMRRLTLLSSNVIADEIYLHYRVNRAAKMVKS